MEQTPPGKGFVMMRTCTGCLIEKTPAEFNDRGDGRVQRRCAECKRVYLREYYQKNKESEKARIGASKSIAAEKTTEIAWELRKAPCADCGRTLPPVAMDFAFVEKSEARDIYGSISHMARSGMSVESFMLEIAKCEVVCACCNRMREWHRDHPTATK